MLLIFVSSFLPSQIFIQPNIEQFIVEQSLSYPLAHQALLQIILGSSRFIQNCLTFVYIRLMSRLNFYSSAVFLNIQVTQKRMLYLSNLIVISSSIKSVFNLYKCIPLKHHTSSIPGIHSWQQRWTTDCRDLHRLHIVYLFFYFM